MRTPEEDKAKFQESVGILVKAYLNDTIVPSDCKRCVVGNMIAAGKANYKFYETGISWYTALGIDGTRPHLVDYNHSDVIKTGYSASQLILIEHTFMTHTSTQFEGDKNFNGLMAVVDVLASIHNIDLKEREEAKTLFVRP